MRYDQIINEANYKNKFDLANPLTDKSAFDAGTKALGATSLRPSKPQAGGAIYYIDDKVGIVGFRIPDGDGFKYYLAKEPFMPTKKNKGDKSPSSTKAATEPLTLTSIRPRNPSSGYSGVAFVTFSRPATYDEVLKLLLSKPGMDPKIGASSDNSYKTSALVYSKAMSERQLRDSLHGIKPTETAKPKAEPKTEPEQKAEPVKKELPPLPQNPKFNEYTSYTTIADLKKAIRKEFGEDIPIEYIEAPHLPDWYNYGGKKHHIIMYYNPETNQPLGRWEVTDSQMVPGRGRVSYGRGSVALKDQSDPAPKAAKVEPKATGVASPQEMQDVLSRIRSLMKAAMSSGGSRYSTPYTGDWGDIEQEGTGYHIEVRDWGGWQIPVDAQLEDGEEEDYDWEELEDSWVNKMNKIVDEIQAKFPNVKVSWTTEEKNYIGITVTSRM